MKKIIALLLTFVLTISLIGCSESQKANPTISNATSELASVTEGSFTYKVTNGEIYNALKAQYGSVVLADMIDTQLLKSEKNEAGKDFYSAVTDEEIEKEIKLAMYGEEEETEEKKEQFLSNLFISNGVNTTDPFDTKVKEIYRLTLAKKAYAKFVATKEVKEHNEKYEAYTKLSKEEQEAKLVEDENYPTTFYFADSKVKAEYAKENYSSYEFISVPFTTKAQAMKALESLNVKVVEDAWYKGDELLTPAQIKSVFEDLYKLVYGYKADAAVKTLKESEINANILNALKKLEVLTETSKATDNFYTKGAREIGSGNEFVYLLKVSENIATAFEDLTDAQVKEAQNNSVNALIDEKVTTNYVNVIMANLRKDKGLVIYDTVVEGLYVNNMSSLAIVFETTKEEKQDVVATLEGVEIKADDFFKALLAYQGPSMIVAKLTEKRALVNTDLNKYYDVKTSKWLDDKKQKEMKELIDSEKANFENGNYKDHGYDPAKMNWDLFIKTLYTVDSEEELLVEFLIEQINSEYAKKLNKLGEKDSAGKFVLSNEDAQKDKYYELINNKMEEEVNKKFKVEGIHLLINHYATVEDYLAGKNLVAPKDWSEEQKQAAKELTTKVVEYVNDSKGTYQERLTDFADAYKACPIVGDVEIVSEGGNVKIDVKKYKSLGLYVKYESLGSFSEGKMVKNFNDAVKEIWDADKAKGVFDNDDLTDFEKATIYSKEIEGVKEYQIETEFGYHVYINLESSNIDYVTSETVTEGENKKVEYRYLPTFEELRLFIENESSSELQSRAKTVLKNLYSKVSEELASDEFAFVMMINAVKAVMSSYQSNNDSVSSENVSKYIESYINYTFEDLLTNVTKDYLYIK